MTKKIKNTALIVTLAAMSTSIAYADDVDPTMIAATVGANMTLLPSQSPSSVTVITSDMIEASGARNLAEAISLAPGMIVGNRTAGQQSVSYLGMSDEYARRLQVLLNGESIYTPTTGGVNWAMIPVLISDVDRIEILHGPGSAVHGENAMLATINIVTKRPETSRKASADVYFDSRGLKTETATANLLSQRFSAMASIGHTSDPGTDKKTIPFVDSYGSKTGTIHAQYDLGPMCLSISAGQTNGTENRAGYDQPWLTTLPEKVQPYSRYYENNYVTAKLLMPVGPDGQLKTTLSRISDSADYNYLANVGKLSIPVNGNYSGTRTELDVAYTTPITESIKSAAGLSIRQDRLDSIYYIGKKSPYINNIQSAYMGLSWSPDEKWTFNGEVNAEKASIMDTAVSPTVSVNYHLNPSNTLRIGYADGYRMPMVYEQFADRSVTLPKIGMVTLAASMFSLKPEQNQTIDAAWQYDSGKYLSISARIFQSKIVGLVNPVKEPYQGLSITPGYILTFANNQGAVKMNGAEGQVKWHPGRWLLWGSWSSTNLDLTDADPATRALYEQTVPKNIISLLAAYDFGWGITASVNAKHLSRFKWAWPTYPLLNEQNVVGVRVEKKLRINQSDLSIALIGENLAGMTSDFRADAGSDRTFGVQIKMDY